MVTYLKYIRAAEGEFVVKFRFMLTVRRGLQEKLNIGRCHHKYLHMDVIQDTFERKE